MTCLHAIQPPESMYSQHKLVIFTAFVNGGKTYTMIGHWPEPLGLSVVSVVRETCPQHLGTWNRALQNRECSYRIES